MSTRTMRPPPRRVLSASTGTIQHTNSNMIRNHGFSGITQKRKERDESFVVDGMKTKSSPSTMLAAGIPGMSKPNASSQIGSKPGMVNANKGSKSGPSLPNNQILMAGYLAHEFLSQGTLFGQAWDPTRPEGNGFRDVNDCVSSDSQDSRPFCGEGGKTKPFPAPAKQEEDRHEEEKWKKGEDGRRRYEEVSNLLKAGGTHLPSIVNPSQLGRFLQL